MTLPQAPAPLTPRDRTLFALVLCLATWLASPGLINEEPVALAGDSARYIMNGVFFYDFIADGGASSVDDVIRYAELYYARYPALSLGHHAPLTSVALVPYFAVFGISLFAARLAMLTWFLLAAWGLFALARRMYGAPAALWASLLFVTSPYLLEFGQATLSEMPMLALVLWGLNALFVFSRSGRPIYYAWFVTMVVASVYARQMAAYMFPIYAFLFWYWGSLRHIRQWQTVALTIAAASSAVPVLLLTQTLSPFNVSVATYSVESFVRGTRELAVYRLIASAVESHLLPGATALVLGALAAGLWRRDHRLVVPTIWAATILLEMALITGGMSSARYSIAAVPAFYLCASTLAGIETPRTAAIAARLALAVVAASQLWAAHSVQPLGGAGYETAARFVLDRGPMPTVLFNGGIDTGQFAFFIRKHDPERRLVVVRSDKLFTTSLMSRQEQEARVSSISDMHEKLQSLGVRLVVHEDRPVPAPTLELFASELRGSRFREVARFPIQSRDRRTTGVDLVVYQYLDAKDPDPSTQLDLNIPIGGRHIRTTLGDLMRSPTGRGAALK